MVDDHDRCDWVDISSGTGSPGWSTRTKGRETVAVVIVVVVRMVGGVLWM